MKVYNKLLLDFVHYNLIVRFYLFLIIFINVMVIFQT